MTSISMSTDFQPAQKPQTHTQTPASVQILSMLLFAAFAIPVTIVALNVFWPAGVAIAVILAWRGGFGPRTHSDPDLSEIKAMVQKLSPDATRRPSGNASFDAYRSDTLQRLEQEQEKFEGFLTRLRDAKDKTEFDKFMDDRAAVSHSDDETKQLN